MIRDISQESNDNYLVPSFSAKEKNIERVVKNCGRLVMATHNTDYDSHRNFIGDYSREFEIAIEYMKKYNPEGLSLDEYREAHSKGELVWQ